MPTRTTIFARANFVTKLGRGSTRCRSWSGKARLSTITRAPPKARVMEARSVVAVTTSTPAMAHAASRPSMSIDTQYRMGSLLYCST
ncbi:MAG: hypothetical protein BWY76_01967 [bacterium ADurb.Bin429]|nr:MAG: hypothetical protein BWY76_01967 [bacterium ADurb.Bin429]